MSETNAAPAGTAPAAAPGIASILDGAPAPGAAAPQGQGPGTTPPAGAPEWLSGLPEALRADPVLSRYQSVEALAKGHVEAQGLIGRKGLIAPKEGDPPEVHAAWREALGVPKDPAGYEFKVEKAAPETWNDGTATVLRGWAHELGLTPQQAQGLAERYATMVTGHEARMAEETDRALREEWGAAHDRKVAAATAAAKEYLSPGAIQALKAAGLGAHPEIIRALAKIGETIGNHDGAAGMGAPPLAMTPADARAKAAEIRAHPGYFDRRHPEHQHLVRRAVELEKMATVRVPA